MDMLEEFEFCPPMVGKPAPDFTGTAYHKSFEGDFRQVGLADYKGHWLVLFFYPAAFTGVCSSELVAFAKDFEQFAQAGAKLLAVSGDSQFVLKKLVESGEAGDPPFPLLSDLNHHIGMDYGVYLDELGLNLRGLFIIDPQGKLRYQVVHEPFVGRSTEETLRVLLALQSGGACPANWKPGK